MAGMHLGPALRHMHRLFGDGTLAELADVTLLQQYACQRDELAFEALVQRHGPMVMAVCRGILADPNDADDAFQAAFLLLARKAGALWVNDSLGGWLHRVACRIALQVKSDGARRRERERRAAELAGTRNPATAPWDDLSAVLHQEIDRLPERYRKPVVLCCLEEMTYQQAANHLGWSVGTTRGRLARGRELLRARLISRGATLAGGALLGLPNMGGASAVSTATLHATVRAARHFLLGDAAAAGTVSTATTIMVDQAIRSMMITKLKMAGAAAIAVGLLSFVAGGLAAMGPAELEGALTASIPGDDDSPRPAPTSAPARPAGQAKTTETKNNVHAFQGQVPGPDEPPATGAILGKIADAAGAPIAGVRVDLHRFLPSRDGRWHRWARAGAPVVSDKAGAYRFQGPPGGYFLVVRKTGFAQVFLWSGMSNDQQKKIDIVLKPAVSPVIQLTDASGRPVSGASVREFGLRGVNGQRFMEQLDLKTLGLLIPPSDEAGRLRLPPLAAGDFLEVTIEHPRHAPVRFKELAVAEGVVARATMQPGVTLIFGVATDNPADRIEGAVVDLRHEPYDHPSTSGRYEIDFDADGLARLAVAPGDYSSLILRHDDFYLTPTLFSKLRVEPGHDVNLQFKARRKVPARGRIIMADTGRPVAKVVAIGEIGNDEPMTAGGKWSFAESVNTDAEGVYTIPLAAGPARISLQGSELISETEHIELAVSADGSTVIPDIRVRRLPKLAGVVRNPDGSPAARAIVRIRGREMGDLQPVITNEKGQFEIQPDSIAVDATGKRQFDHQVVAFDPYHPLAARCQVRLDKPVNIVLKLEPHEPDWPLSAFADEMGGWERGTIPAGEKEHMTAISLRGLVPPELDAAAWINTDGEPLTLASLRGKYVLLDFWFKGCGPCHHDFPSVKLAHERFHDKGVVVIGVHTNMNPAEAVRAHVAEIGLPFPVMVDHPDGRTVSRYQLHGISLVCPNYVLIDPEGKVLLDDRTIAHPTLRSYKLEIIRKYLLMASPASRPEPRGNATKVVEPCPTGVSD
jgi:RNA polymerase sigma factor (sigma-70 family)